MLIKILNRLGLYTTSGWMDGYDGGYTKGYTEGHDFGERVAHNQTIRLELNGILNRYGQLQVKMIRKPKSEIQEAIAKFTNDEIERLKMELQER